MEIDLKALALVEKESGISVESLVRSIEDSLLRAYHRIPGAIREARVETNPSTGAVMILAAEYDEEGNKIGEFDDTPSNFGYMANQLVRSLIKQRLREAENDAARIAFSDKIGTVQTGRVQHSRGQIIRVQLGEFEGVLTPEEQVPGERYRHGDWIRVYVINVQGSPKGPRIELSRTHPGLVKGLLAREVPEIATGEVVIESVAREAGIHTKVAVRSTRPNMRARSVVIGPRGQRIKAVMRELGYEKIDVVDYADDPALFIANALSPARVSSVTIEPGDILTARVIVPDFQYSLAIGKEGQNVRLAVRLTGARIDIQSDSESLGQVMPSQETQPDVASSIIIDAAVKENER